MKFLQVLCLLLIATSNASAQRGGKQALLTRTQKTEAQGRLAAMGYWTGAIDGRLDPASRSALIAFQKWEGRPVTGRLTPDELEAIRNSAAPKARELGYEHAEVDLDRQVLLMVSDRDRIRILPVSTGNGKKFVYYGQTSIAYTPRGRFLVYDKEAGWGNGPLGSVYYANYISGGIAIHGSPSVPTQTASHGCIRVPMFAARDLSKLMPLGTIVLVYDKVSFVSAKSWVESPELKQAALKDSTTPDYSYGLDRRKSAPKSSRVKQPRARTIRADHSP